MKVYKMFCIICASSLPYLFTLNGDFVFDDSEAIVKNKDVSSDSWTDAFYNDFWGASIKSNLSHKSYRPLTVLTFRLNYFLNKEQLSAPQFKAANLVCHVLCCLVVWRVLEELTRSVGQGAGRCSVAFFAALLFAVHPVHAEAVCGAVGRADLLAAITFFLALLSYMEATRSPKLTYLYLLATVLLAGLSMLFKENGITVLGFCTLYELVIHLELRDVNEQKTLISNTKKSSVSTKARKKVTSQMPKQGNQNAASLVARPEAMSLGLQSSVRIAVMLATAALMLYGRWLVMGETKPVFKETDNPAAFSHSIFTKVMTYQYIYCINLLLFVWPQWLCYDWSMGCIPLIESILDPRVLCVCFLYLYAIFVIRAVCHKRNKGPTKRLIVLGAMLIGIPFLPAANVFYTVGFVVAERVLYIPSAGYCLLFALGLHKLVHMFNSRTAYKINMLFFAVLISFYALKSWKRSYEWQSEYQLFIGGALVCPLNAKVHYNVAKALDAAGEPQRAMQSYREAIRLYPEYIQALNNLANLLKNQKRFEEAELYLRAAIRIKQDFPAAWMNLGIVLVSTQRYEAARDAYETALRYRNKYPDCHYNFGNLYLVMNKTEEAKKSWLAALELNPRHSMAWANLLASLDNADQNEKALEMISKALKHRPDAPTVLFAAANILGRLGRHVHAETLFLRALALFEAQGAAAAVHYGNLGVLYHRWKKYDQAEAMYRKALDMDSQLASARSNLRTLVELKKDKERAKELEKRI